MKVHVVKMGMSGGLRWGYRRDWFARHWWIDAGRLRLCLIHAAVALLVAVGSANAQEKPAAKPAATAAADDTAKAPALTEVQKLQIANLAQRLELDQTQVRAAQLDFQQASQALQQLVQALQVEGYTLDLQSLSYVKKPDAAKAPAKKDDSKR